MADGTPGLLVFAAIFACLLGVGRATGDVVLAFAGGVGTAGCLLAFVVLNAIWWGGRDG